MWKGKKMIIAVTYDHGQVFQHFGRTEQFKLYLVVDGEVKGAQVIGTNGAGHGALAGFLTGVGVDVLICGGMGPSAQMALQDAGIKIYAGASGSADMAVIMARPIATTMGTAKAIAATRAALIERVTAATAAAATAAG